MRIGIDVGGTNTDAVVLAGQTVIASAKTATTADVTSGITGALHGLRERTDFDAADVQLVVIGTTHFINALVQARRLASTASVRLGLPATDGLPPFTDWPETLTDALSAQGYLAHGGYEFDGSPISPLNPDELRSIARDIRAKGLRSVAISGVFSPLNGAAECEAAEILSRELGDDIPISLSHEIGRVGLLERENATILNAALRHLAAEIVDGLTAAVHTAGIFSPIYLSQNDGTVQNGAQVRRYPVSTFASGPTNSMRGAALTSGYPDCAVIDIGGTTTDIGVLHGGFPRESMTAVTVADVRTNFRIPDVFSLGIGGGSLVNPETAEVGPESVGYRLTTEALVFGGNTLTASDIAVAAGRANMGDPSRVAHLDRGLVARVLTRIEERLSQAVDQMRTSMEPVPVVVVGGGSVLLADTLPIFGAITRPAHHDVANAIGASIAQVSGEVDRVVAIEAATRERVLAELRAEACERARENGAVPASVSVVEIDEIPLPYLPGGVTRVRVRAIGDLNLGAAQ